MLITITNVYVFSASSFTLGIYLVADIFTHKKSHVHKIMCCLKQQKTLNKLRHVHTVEYDIA